MLSSVEGFLVSIYNCSTIKGATTSSFRGAVKEMTRQKNHHEFHFFYAVDYTAKFYIFHEMNVSNQSNKQLSIHRICKLTLLFPVCVICKCSQAILRNE